MNKPITKTLIASALILVLAVSFVACGGRGNKPPVSTDPSTTDAANIIPDITDDNTDTDTVPETDKDGTTNKDTDNTTTTKKVDNTTTTKKKTDNTTTTKKKVNNTTTTKKKANNTTTTKKTDTTTTTQKDNQSTTQVKKIRIAQWYGQGYSNEEHGSGQYSKAGYEFPRKYCYYYTYILLDMEGRGYCTEAEFDKWDTEPTIPGDTGVFTTGKDGGSQF